MLVCSSPPHAVKQGRRGDKMSPRWVDQTFVQRFPAPHNDAPRAHNGTLRDELGRQRRKSLFGAHAWAARGQRASFETALAAAKEEGNLFIIQSKRKKGRGELLHRKARQNTLWGRNEGWIIQGGSGTVQRARSPTENGRFSPTKCFLLVSAKEAEWHSEWQLRPLKSTHVWSKDACSAPENHIYATVDVYAHE